MNAHITRLAKEGKEIVDSMPYNTIAERAEAIRLLNEYRLSERGRVKYKLTY